MSLFRSINLARTARLPTTASRTFITSTSRTAQPALAQTFTHDNDADMPVAQRSAAQWSDFGRDHVSHGLARLRDHVIVKGEGLNLYTADGKKLLDFTAGIGVTNLGQ